MELPVSFLENMKKLLSPEEFNAYLDSYSEERVYGLRVNTNKLTPEEFEKICPFEIKKIPWIDNGYYYSGKDKPAKDPYYYAGLYYLQEPSAMTPAHVLPIEPGDRVLDICAAPGGKSLHIADLLKDTGCVEARDLTMQKVMLIKENIERCHANNVVAVVKDALELDETAIDKADIVICDLPCSGLGIIGRKADIKYKVDEEKIEQLANLQREILKVVQNYVKPGGCLIFSTCTVNQTENDENVRWFEENYGFELESIEEYLPEKFRNRTGDRGYIQIFPKAGENDGFFISKFRRKKV